MAQVALAWLLARGDDIVPIPGTKRRTYLEQNVAAVDIELSEAEIATLDGAFPPGRGRRACAIPNFSSKAWESKRPRSVMSSHRRRGTVSVETP